MGVPACTITSGKGQWTMGALYVSLGCKWPALLSLYSLPLSCLPLCPLPSLLPLFLLSNFLPSLPPLPPLPPLTLPLQLKFEDDLAITKMFSGEGEEVPFCETLYPHGNVEDWLLEVERVMRASLKAIIRDSLQDYKQVCLSSLTYLPIARV